MTLENLIEKYLDNCRDRGLAAKTVKWYGWHLRRCHAWLMANNRTTLDAGALAAYVHSCSNLAHSSRRYMIAALKAFGSWMARHGFEDPAAGLVRLKADETLPPVLSPTEVERLLVALDEEPLRERALVYLFLDSGLRVSELVALERQDLDLQACQLRVRKGKGGRGRVVYFSQTTANALADYLATHDHPYVWLGVKIDAGEGPLTDSGVRRALGRLARRHGFARLNPHTLRRTCGTEFAARGVNQQAVAGQLGHRSVTTTSIYVQLAGDRQRNAILQASPVEHGLAILVTNWPMPDTSN